MYVRERHPERAVFSVSDLQSVTSSGAPIHAGAIISTEAQRKQASEVRVIISFIRVTDSLVVQ